jgi:hypothetical protein
MLQINEIVTNFHLEKVIFLAKEILMNFFLQNFMNFHSEKVET